MTKTLSFRDFKSRRNHEFQIEQESNKWIAAKLVEAKKLKFKYSGAGEVQKNAFSLVFQAMSDVYLPQRIYTIKHVELGEHQIFLVPIRPDDDGTYFEAVFT